MRDHPARLPRFQLSVFLMQWALYGTLGVFMAFLLWTYELQVVLKMLAEF